MFDLHIGAGKLSMMLLKKSESAEMSGDPSEADLDVLRVFFFDS